DLPTVTGSRPAPPGPRLHRPTARQRGYVSVSVPRARPGITATPRARSGVTAPSRGASPAPGLAVPVPRAPPASATPTTPPAQPRSRSGVTAPSRGSSPAPGLAAPVPRGPPASATPMTPPSQPPGPRERGNSSPDRPGATTSARQQSENGSQGPVFRRPLIV